MFKRHDPAGLAPASSAYAMAVETPANVRMLHVSGQVPVRPDGSVPENFAEQYDLVWANIRAVLASAGMGMNDLVKMTTYVVDAGHIGPAREGRDKLFQGLRIASTLVVVTALASPKFLLEIEVTAAQA